MGAQGPAPVLLGVVGDSAAGKTTITTGIAGILGADRVTVICSDDYHRYNRRQRAALNITALTRLSRMALPGMIARGEGGILNVASTAAFQAGPNLALYYATKAFVLSLSEAIWSEVRDSGIRVIALCPGRTPTEFQAVAGTGSADSAFGVRSADQVVAAALDALESGRSYEVPGLENYLATWLVRVLPRSAVTRAAKRLVRRAAEKK